jgi:hypothetical protein
MHDMHLDTGVVMRARSFGTEVPQDGSMLGVYFKLSAAFLRCFRPKKSGGP